MTIRVHIERLVVDPRALSPGQVPLFQAALGEALTRLHAPSAEPTPRPRDGVTRLAERTARSIYQQMARR